MVGLYAGAKGAAKARYAFERLTALPGVEPLVPDAPVFKEFAIRLPRQAAGVRDAAIDRGVLAGVPVRGGDGHGLLVAVTERRDRGEIDALVDAVGEAIA